MFIDTLTRLAHSSKGQIINPLKIKKNIKTFLFNTVNYHNAHLGITDGQEL